jgi:aerobic carbon-monoxide dehydrogenase large subunit
MVQQTSVGQPLPRKEDFRFLTGTANFSDDLRPSDCLFARVVRANVPHARIVAIDTSAARNVAGVEGIYVAADLRAAGISAIPSLSRAQPFAFLDRHGHELPDPSQFPLAEHKVRYLGEPVVFVVATSEASARDAAERIEIDYEIEPAVISYADAQTLDSAKVWSDLDSNVSFEWELGDAAATSDAFEQADQVITATLANNRVIIAFMEPRSALAQFDGERYTLTTGSQGAPGLQAPLCSILGIPSQQLRVVTPDTGGGFGARGGVYPEFVLALFAAAKSRRPVKWTADRTEAFVSDYQSRDHEFAVSLALNDDGFFKGLRVHADWRHGAYATSRSFWVMTQYLPPTLGGVYDVGPLHLRLRGLFSNTTPQAAYRGIGRVEATYIIESLVDAAARSLDCSPAALRQQNMVHPQQLPWQAAGGARYTSGDFPANLARAIEIAGWHDFDARKQESRQRGQLRGIGIAMFVENDGGAPIEFATVRATLSGELELLAGTQDFGMGHQTVFSQVLADQLGVPFEQISVFEGDTDLIPQGSGSHGSRSARIGGGAVVAGAQAWIERGKLLASQLFEAAPSDINYSKEGATFSVIGTDRNASISSLAKFADANNEAFSASADFSVSAQAHSNGCQIVEVEIDPQTGVIKILEHSIVMDAGVLLNPLIVVGQMHGGLAQGLGQAMLEHLAFDADSGQLLSGSFMDYAIPRADDLPNFSTVFNEIREADNVLGVKGAGEGPTSGAPAAFMNAVRAAVSDFGGAHLDMPATPERVWRALRQAPAQH